MTRVILIAGLPGSGKTHHLRALVRDLSAFGFDDYRWRASGPALRQSLHHRELDRALRTGRPCVLADVEWCRRELRLEAEAVVCALSPRVRVEWRCFANDPEACRRNAVARARREARNLREELAAIERLTRTYTFPAGARPMPVWAPRGAGVTWPPDPAPEPAR